MAILDWVMISLGAGLLFIGPITILKIYKGSKETSAYILTVFTCLNAFVFISLGLTGLSDSGLCEYLYDAFYFTYQWLSI